MKKISVRIVLGLAFAISLNVHAVENSTETRTVNVHQVFDSGSPGAAAVVQWLKQRKDEGQFPGEADFASVQRGMFTVDIHSETSGPIGVHQQNAIPDDTTGPGGVQLPVTGTPGQVILVSSCTVGVGTTTTYYQWKVDSSGTGIWVDIDSTIHNNSSQKCEGPHGNQPGMQ